MKLATLILLEGYKQKKGWLWLFLLVIPTGTTLAMFLDFTIRYDYLLDTANPEYGSWDILLIENHSVLGWGMFLPMFIGIIYSLIYQVEESQNNWKQILSLPICRESVYFSKFLAGFLCCAVLILLNIFGLILVGYMIDFPEPVDWSSYLLYAGKQIVMILAVTSLHNWLSSYFKNAMIPIALGFAGVILSGIVIFHYPEAGKFFPYTYPFFADGLVYKELTDILPFNVVLMLLFLCFGMWQFKRKDIL
ncbi:ABC transporter permease [Cytobacillus oceanisediminis]|uniref:ABC transporter permease n=1 Tax=Cytobacillus oceanisediminis TaxID=665099 RepID=UPI001CC96106|nr:ABC transporter permease [Cytobacillus oceanisediminis]MBZ9533307.1 ABC transporter permease [Cytobacillus oceanisediminis]MDU1846418.1 ABC transporter permease [Niallia nealsonii]